MRSFEDLDVWRRAFELIPRVYALAAAVPPTERFELASQLRTAATSIAANIAEGTGRRTIGEFRHFLSIASGSASELECLLMIAVKLRFATQRDTAPLVAEIRRIRRMLHGLDRTLARDDPRSTKFRKR